MADPGTAPTTAPSTLVPPPPRPRRPAATLDRRALVPALGAGVVCAIAIAGHAPGVGVTLAAVAVAVAVAVADGHGGSPTVGPWRWATAALTLGSAVIPAVTDAGWIVAWLAVAAVILVAAGSSRAVSWRGLVRRTVTIVPASARATAILVRSLRRVFPASHRGGSIGRTVVLTLGVLLLFGSLFASADELFSSLLQRYLLPDLDLPLLVSRTAWFVGGAVVVTTTLTLTGPGVVEDHYPPPPSRYLRGIEWKVPLGGLVTLFAAFVVVQFPVLFGGHDQVLATSGLTYAGYARAGFAQLLVVAGLTLAVVGLTSRFAAAASAGDRRVRRVLLATLCVLTLVVLASALDRLHVYEEAFGSTRLRLAAQAIAWSLAALFALVLAAGAVHRTTWLPRATLLLGGMAVVLFAAVQPDAIVAEGNVERFERTGQLDLAYVSGLSTDAVPALIELPHDVRGCVLGGHARRVDDERTQGWQAWNLSRARAASLLDGLPTSCTPEAHGLTWAPPSRY